MNLKVTCMSNFCKIKSKKLNSDGNVSHQLISSPVPLDLLEFSPELAVTLAFFNLLLAEMLNKGSQECFPQ